MKNILYLISQPLDQRNYDRFGIQKWIDGGWKVEVWDLTPLSNPIAWKKYKQHRNKTENFRCCYTIENLKQLGLKCKEIKNSKYLVDLAEEDIYAICINIFLKFKGMLRIINATGSIPLEEPPCFTKRFLNVIRKNPKIIFKKTCMWCLKKIFKRLIKPGLKVISGIESTNNTEQADRLIYAHNLDYDIYLEIKKNITPEPHYGIVFIDQNYCYHPDFDFMREQSQISPEQYFPSICRALKSVANELNTSICVALHPRSTYKNLDNMGFEDITVYQGITPHLIKNCEVIITHDSTILQLAVLFEKPIIFITTHEIENSSIINGSIKTMAKSVGKIPINIDLNLSKFEWRNEIVINKEKYADYKTKYIKTNGSPEKNSWDILIDYINININPVFLKKE